MAENLTFHPCMETSMLSPSQMGKKFSYWDKVFFFFPFGSLISVQDSVIKLGYGLSGTVSGKIEDGPHISGFQSFQLN